MTIKYFLFVVFMGNMQVVGPFDGLIACEKAASQARIAVMEMVSIIVGSTPFSTACMSQKHVNFKYAEPKAGK